MLAQEMENVLDNASPSFPVLLQFPLVNFLMGTFAYGGCWVRVLLSYFMSFLVQLRL